MEILPENLRIIFFGLAVLATINGVFATIYSHLKPTITDQQKYLTKGLLVFAIGMLIASLPLVISVHSPFNKIISISSVISLIYGVYLLRKANKLSKTILYEQRKITEIGASLSFIVGIISLLFVPVSGLGSIGIIAGSIYDKSLSPQQEWWFMIFGILAGIVCALLAVVGWRLIKVRKGWKGEIFAPYWWWFRVGGWLFMVVSIMKLWERNIQGVLAALIAITLFIISSRRIAKKWELN